MIFCFARMQSATTGLPEHMCKFNMEKNNFVLGNMDKILDSLTRGLDLNILSKGYGVDAARPAFDDLDVSLRGHGLFQPCQAGIDIRIIGGQQRIANADQMAIYPRFRARQPLPDLIEERAVQLEIERAKVLQQGAHIPFQGAQVAKRNIDVNAGVIGQIEATVAALTPADATADRGDRAHGGPG